MKGPESNFLLEVSSSRDGFSGGETGRRGGIARRRESLPEEVALEV